MNRKARQAALRILLLTEEFSPEELSEALSLIGGRKEEDLSSFLARMASSSRKPRRSTSRDSSRGSGESRALHDLKSIDIAKYQILRDFENAVREGRVLRDLDEFRAFGRVLAKDFTPGKSRKEALARLTALLAQLDVEAIRSALAKVPSIAGPDGENSFRRLANQIISGPRERAVGDSP
jgi:hypothetical protein